MSSSDHDEVGYGKPPKKHRFSTNNQPRRRKKKVAEGRGHNVLAHVLRLLNEDVSINVDGKPGKTKAGDVFARRFVKQGLSGTFSEQLKFAGFLRAYGELDPEKIREEIQEEYSQQLQEEQRINSELLEYLTDAVAMIRESCSAFRLVSDAFVAAKSKCSCDAFAGDEEIQKLILEWSQVDDGELTVAEETEPFAGGGAGCAPLSGAIFPGAAAAAGPATAGAGVNKVQQGFPVDDLSAGKIGND